MLPLADLLQLDADERSGRFPYIWAVDGKQRLMRLIVSEELVRACEERLQFWRQLKDVAARPGAEADSVAIAERVRAELMQRISASLGLSGSDAGTPALALPAPQAGAGASSAAASPAAGSAHEPCWVESPECSACDECTTLAPGAFAYNGQRQAIVINPKGAKYADLVKCAEKCTAGCLHPGTPWNPAEPGLDKLVARAAKYH
jgi:pyruvate-ferredoxin/flavodoxin oxidoreductase